MKTKATQLQDKTKTRSIGPNMGSELIYDAICSYKFNKRCFFENEIEGELDRIKSHFLSISSAFVLPIPIIKHYKSVPYEQKLGFVIEIDIKFLLYDISYSDTINYERLFSLIVNYERDMQKRYDNIQYSFNLSQQSS